MDCEEAKSAAATRFAPSPSTSARIRPDCSFSRTGSLSASDSAASVTIFPQNKTRPASASARDVASWFGAMATCSVGSPRQQRSQVVEPPAPMARSAAAISSAMFEA